MLLKMFLIPMMVKATLATRQPLLCALIYGAALFTNALMFDLAFGAGWGPVLQQLALVTAVSLGVFTALLKSEDYGALYWLVLFLGAGLLLLV